MSNSSKDPKRPRIIKSSCSIEKPKLETLHIPNKRSPTAIKSHEESDSSKSKLSLKCHFGDLQTCLQGWKLYLLQ
jgi:hypothetical protein